MTGGSKATAATINDPLFHVKFKRLLRIVILFELHRSLPDPSSSCTSISDNTARIPPSALAGPKDDDGGTRRGRGGGVVAAHGACEVV
jgi:hypothetical protein